MPKNKTYKTGLDDLLYHLDFFNTFKELKSPIKGPIEDSGVIKLYKPSLTLCLYLAPAQNMVGRVPLIPLFLAGNSILTSPYMHIKHRDSGFPMVCADQAAVDGGRDSNVYEIIPWLWQFGRGKPHLGGLTVENTAERKTTARNEWGKRGA